MSAVMLPRTRRRDDPGPSRSDPRDPWDEARRNEHRLEICLRHDFVEQTWDSRTTLRWKCSNCQGRIDDMAVAWYMAGRRHA